MPYRPKTTDRPWITKQPELPGQGRKIINPFYQSPAWRKLRHAFKSGFSTHLGTDNPHPNSLCIQCYKAGRLTPVYAVDHIKPINPANSYDTMKGKYGQPLEWTNLQPLCESCNAKKTAKDKYI